MKIKDILSEQPNSYQAGKSFAKKATSPSQWGLGGDADYEGGKAFVDKLLDPSQWFKGGNKTAQPQQTKQPVAKTNPNELDLGDKPPHEVRANLDNMISGKVFASDVSTAKSIYDQMNKGTYKPAVDIESTMRSLKKVIDQQPLSKDDTEIFKKLKAAISNIN
jgi:hypothetical protein